MTNYSIKIIGCETITMVLILNKKKLIYAKRIINIKCKEIYLYD